MPKRVRIGTRSSSLALAQAFEVRERLHQVLAARFGSYPIEAIEILPMSTLGDRSLGSLTEIGGKGLFTIEIEEALLSGAIDLAVHSLKDMPTELLAGLQITAVPEREVVVDFLIVSAATAALMAAIEIEQLPQRSRVGTSSLRRALQLQEQRPDLQIVPLRGNIGTRLKKLAAGEVEATVLAEAGLKRLGLCQDQIIGAAIPMKVMIPAVAQGALAIETTVDSPVIPWVLAIDHRATHLAILAERAMLRLLDGSCRTPIGGITERQADGRLRLVGGLASSDGRRMIRAEFSAVITDGAAAIRLGEAVGQELLLRRAQGSESVD